VAEGLLEQSGGKIKTGVYHAERKDNDKELLHRQWRKGTIQVVCATIGNISLWASAAYLILNSFWAWDRQRRRPLRDPSLGASLDTLFGVSSHDISIL
jgi:hypothetical protein